jgi:hypothetical protein
MNAEEFQEFVKRNSTLINFWDECPDSLWMLRLLLNYQNYCAPEKVDRYTNWLRDWVKGDRTEEEAAFDLRDFTPRTEHIEELEQSIEGGTAYDNDRRSSLINSLVIALSKSERALGIKETDAILEYFNIRFMSGLRGDSTKMPESDRRSVRIKCLEEQADKLRELLGNPFLSA